MGADAAESTGLDTLRGRDYPSVRQFSIFAPNKVGQLTNLSRVIESAELRICSLSIVDSADCVIIRLVSTYPERAYELLKLNRFEFCEVDLVVVELPDSAQPLSAICAALLQAEINIHYCFPILVAPHGRSAMAFHVDAHDIAARTLEAQGFTLLTEGDLED